MVLNYYFFFYRFLFRIAKRDCCNFATVGLTGLSSLRHVEPISFVLCYSILEFIYHVGQVRLVYSEIIVSCSCGKENEQRIIIQSVLRHVFVFVSSYNRELFPLPEVNVWLKV